LAESDSASWARRDWLGVGLVTIGAAALRLVALGQPAELVFDEIFYAQDACIYVAGSEAVCGISDLTSRAHPPLGKWLIGSGIVLLGYDPFGWRIASAVAGTLTVALVYLLAWRLLRPVASGGAATLGAVAASALFATDFLHLVQSRVAMLDVFVALFVVIATLAVVLDRDRRREGDDQPPLLARLTLGRPWRLLAGAALGAATAVKWSGGYIGLALIGLTIAWEIAARRGPGVSGWRAFGRAFRGEAVPSVIAFGLVPLLVYIASYTGRMPGELFGPPWQEGTVWRGIWEHQWAMLEFHVTLSGNHPYESPPWSWLFLKRPVAYYFEDGGGTYRHILALGNPLLWWGGALAVIGVAVAWLRAGAPLSGPEPVVVVGVLSTWGPWLVLAGDRDQVFIWYLLPAIPFLCLALGVLGARAWEARRAAWRSVLAAAAAAVIFSLVFYAPLLASLPVAPADWRLRILFRDCDRPGAPTLPLPDDSTSTGPPPEGWCWI
jgi:dolichyl-phosphate-mannose-protein mannosyltransferase